MTRIDIHNLKVMAYHGALPEEKEHPQLFCFDLSMDYDFTTASKRDDLTLTINYDTIMHDINAICKNNCFDLIESLGRRIGVFLMQVYPIQSLTLTIRKPQAPVALSFDDVSVTLSYTRKTVLLSMGSNVGDRQSYLDMALKRLGTCENLMIQAVSKPFENPPYGGVATEPFINIGVKISTYISPYELLDIIHDIENKAGRKRTERWGNRTLDIDIIFFGDEIVNDDILTIPHPDYANRDFVLKPLKEIEPNFICPLTRKRLRDM